MSKPIATAPRDGTEILVITGAGARVRCRWWQVGFTDSDGMECGGWTSTTDDYPTCWTDGVCWTVNADGRMSDQPVRWQNVERQ